MKRGSVRASFAVSIVAVLLMSLPAMAKGPSQGVITGPGLVDPITLKEPGARTIGPDLASVADESGFFQGVWGGDPDRLTHRPAGDLGPRYTITYGMTMSRRLSGTITQFVFPYAEPLPITYMPAKQRYWGSNETVGGWFVVRVAFKRTLIGLGLPTSSPSPSTVGIDAATATVPPRTGIPPWLSIALAVPALALAFFLIHRRPWRTGDHPQM
jgi:hypothetical protein